MHREAEVVELASFSALSSDRQGERARTDDGPRTVLPHALHIRLSAAEPRYPRLTNIARRSRPPSSRHWDRTATVLLAVRCRHLRNSFPRRFLPTSSVVHEYRLLGLRVQVGSEGVCGAKLRHSSRSLSAMPTGWSGAHATDQIEEPPRFDLLDLFHRLPLSQMQARRCASTAGTAYVVPLDAAYSALACTSAVVG